MTSETTTVLRQTLTALLARATECCNGCQRTADEYAARAKAGGVGSRATAERAARYSGQATAHREHTIRLRTLLNAVDSDPGRFDPALLVNVLAGR